jgi:tRNA(Arg) A34 adenosine deaminase TadA
MSGRDDMAASSAWAALAPPWQAAFEEASRSWVAGNFGVGAVLVDTAADGRPIVARGRNLVAGRPIAGQPLGGNYMAHAEMNAFASMPTYEARGLELVTTLEPCLMCAATALFLNVAGFRYAARDEYYEPFDALWPHHPYTRERRPALNETLAGPLAAFARLLPLHHTIRTRPGSPMVGAARTHRPALTALAADDRRLAPLLDAARLGRSAGDALAAVWPFLPDEPW